MNDPREVRRAKVADGARSIEAAAVAGFAYSTLAIVAIALLDRAPELSLGDQDLSSWYRDAGNRAGLILALNLSAVSAISFLWFVAVIRRRIGDREDRFFATVFLSASIMFVTVWVLAAAAIAAPAVAATSLDSATIDSTVVTFSSGMGEALLLVVAPRLQSVFVLTTSTIVLRTKALPSWLAVVGYVFGVALFATPLITTPLGYAFPSWVALVSAVLLMSHPEGELQTEAPRSEG